MYLEAEAKKEPTRVTLMFTDIEAPTRASLPCRTAHGPGRLPA
jgi:class 3 adenylate cyclase